MNCAWQTYLNLLPVWMRQSVDKQGSQTLQELRLRLHSPPQMITSKGVICLDKPTSSADLRFCVNMASHYSPWSVDTVAKGYITAPGGHRLGLCGNVVSKDGIMTGFQSVTSICLRVARDIKGVSKDAATCGGSILIIGKPGSGKTTLLRDLIRRLSDRGFSTVVVDEKKEIFPYDNESLCFSVGSNTDVLSGCSKPHGIGLALRNMTPDIIALDEITAEEDCQALVYAGWCGVRLVATAHASSKQDLFCRPVYRPLVASKLFDHLIVLHTDKSWHLERMES